MSIEEENKTLGKKLVLSHSFVYVIYHQSKQEICGKVEYPPSPHSQASKTMLTSPSTSTHLVEEEYSTWI